MENVHIKSEKETKKRRNERKLLMIGRQRNREGEINTKDTDKE